MGFTLCGQYILSYTSTPHVDVQLIQLFYVEYQLFVWRYSPGRRLHLVTHYRIFKHSRSQEQFLDVTFSQWPTDRTKVVAYGVNFSNPAESYITVITLPNFTKCNDCAMLLNGDDAESSNVHCLKHNVSVDFMFTITPPYPKFHPSLQLAYPDYIVINTGHYLHILHITYTNPQNQTHCLNPSFDKLEEKASVHVFSDNTSEISEIPSESDCNSVKTNIVDSIIQDFSEYDFENSEYSKPFHELNISCEPLNVTGRSYFTVNLDHRLKMLQNKDINLGLEASSKISDKPKIDKKTLDKTYEFTEENEKCEKLSLFRKKRLADKKYEFSEDNSENIVPFNSLRRERRYFCRSQPRYIRSPDIPNFVSPKPHSPILSPTSRSSQFSPSSNRNIYSPLHGTSSSCCRSPISPRYQGKKFGVYSPSHFDSDCSDDCKLILRQITSRFTDESKVNLSNAGLLIVDGKIRDEKPRWIRKIVRRYCNLDFENGSLISEAQSRDDYISIELPSLVYTYPSNQLDAVPTRISDEIIGAHLQVTQRTFDCEYFCQRQAQSLCTGNHLKFTHCEDYDIKILNVCPISGDIVCVAIIQIGAIPHLAEKISSGVLPKTYTANIMFIWNIVTDVYRLVESTFVPKSRVCSYTVLYDVPEIVCKKVRVMSHSTEKSLQFFRDEDNLIQITMDPLTLNSRFVNELIESESVYYDDDSEEDYVMVTFNS